MKKFLERTLDPDGKEQLSKTYKEVDDHNQDLINKTLKDHKLLGTPAAKLVSESLMNKGVGRRLGERDISRVEQELKEGRFELGKVRHEMGKVLHGIKGHGERKELLGEEAGQFRGVKESAAKSIDELRSQIEAFQKMSPEKARKATGIIGDKERQEIELALAKLEETESIGKKSGKTNFDIDTEIIEHMNKTLGPEAKDAFDVIKLLGEETNSKFFKDFMDLNKDRINTEWQNKLKDHFKAELWQNKLKDHFKAELKLGLRPLTYKKVVAALRELDSPTNIHTARTKEFMDKLTKEPPEA